MSNKILIKRSGTANSVPVTGDLSLGELAINYNDGNLFYKDGGGTVRTLVSTQFVSVAGNIIGGNISTAGLVSVTGNVTAAGNVSGNYILGNGALLTGVITSVANINLGTSNVTVVSSGGNITVGVGGTSNVVVWATTGEYVTGVVSASGNITGGNLVTAGAVSTASVSASGNITGGNIITSGASGNITGANVIAGTTLSATANIIGGNVLTGGLISAGANITGANLVTAGNVFAPAIIANTSTYDTRVELNSAAGIVAITSAGNSTQFTPSGTINLGGASQIKGGTFSGSYLTLGTSQTDLAQDRGGNVTVQVGTGGTIASTWTFAQGGNLLAPGAVSAVGNIIGGNLNATGLSLSGNVVSAMVSAANITTTANISANYFLGNGSLLTGIITSVANINNGNSNITVVSAGGNITASVDGTSNVVVWATTGEYVTGVVSASGNITGGNIITAAAVSAASVSASGNITGGNIVTSGASGNITGANVIAGTTLSATANIIGGNVVTAAAVSAASVSASGNVTGANVNATSVNSTSTLTITTGSNGNINLQPNGTGNIVLSNTYVNSVAYPVQDQDAASKIYVDNLVSTAISYHEAVVAATTTNLAATTGGTITYNQPNGAGNGIGATLTTTGSFNLIDTANVQTANARILVKNEGNAVHNGIYVWSNATVITRSADTDTYGAGDAFALGLNDYFFVQSGNVNLSSSYIVDAPTGVITFGTSNIEFAQFSSSQTYTANTDAGLVLNSTVFNAKVDGVTTAFDVGGNIIVKASATLTTPNIGAATGTSLSVTGNITSGNLNAAGLSLSGNVVSVIQSTSNIQTTGNISGGNIITTGTSGNITGANVISATTLSASANIVGGNLNASGLSLSGNVVSAVNTIANITGGNIISLAAFSGVSVVATGNVTGANVNGTTGVYSGGVQVLTINDTVDGGTY